MPDPLEELKMMLQDSISASKARHEASETRAAADSHAQAAAIASLRADVTEKHSALAQGLTNLNARFDRVEAKADEAHATAHAAQKSYDDVVLSSQEQWRGVVAGQEMLASMLRQQNEEKRRSDEAKAESRRQESLAAARMTSDKEKAAKAEAEAKERQAKIDAEKAAQEAKNALLAAAEKAHREAEERLAQWKLEAEERDRIRKSDDDKRKSRYTVFQSIVLALIASAGGCGILNAHQSAADAATKIDAQSKQLTELSRQFKATPTIAFPGGAIADTVTTVVASPVAEAASSPMPAPAPPAAAPAAAPPPRTPVRNAR